MRLLTFGVASSLTLAVAGCGSVSSAAKEPAAKAVQLQVSAAKFSKQVQITGDEVVFSLMIKNTGSNPAPDVIVQLKGLANKTKYDPQAAVAVRTSPTDLPDDTTHAPWFVETAPGGSPISDSFLYTGGALAPGRTRTLRWR